MFGMVWGLAMLAKHQMNMEGTKMPPKDKAAEILKSIAESRELQKKLDDLVFQASVLSDRKNSAHSLFAAAAKVGNRQEMDAQRAVIHELEDQGLDLLARVYSLRPTGA